jgi:hypothetical protein
VLLSFIEPLSNNGIPIFAISTYDTDYVLLQEELQPLISQRFTNVYTPKSCAILSVSRIP